MAKTRLGGLKFPSSPQGISFTWLVFFSTQERFLPLLDFSASRVPGLALAWTRLHVPKFFQKKNPSLLRALTRFFS